MAASEPATVATNGAPKVEEETEILALFDKWNAALATGDPQKVADMYAEQSELLPTVSNKVRPCGFARRGHNPARASTCELTVRPAANPCARAVARCAAVPRRRISPPRTLVRPFRVLRAQTSALHGL